MLIEMQLCLNAYIIGDCASVPLYRLQVERGDGEAKSSALLAYAQR